MQREGITEAEYCPKYGVKNRRQLRRMRKDGRVDAVRIRNLQAAKGRRIIVIDAPPSSTPRVKDPELTIIQQEIKQVGKALFNYDEKIDHLIAKKDEQRYHNNKLKTREQAAEYCNCSLLIIRGWAGRGWLKKDSDGLYQQQDLDDCIGRAAGLAERFMAISDDILTMVETVRKGRFDIQQAWVHEKPKELQKQFDFVLKVMQDYCNKIISPCKGAKWAAEPCVRPE